MKAAAVTAQHSGFALTGRLLLVGMVAGVAAAGLMGLVLVAGSVSDVWAMGMLDIALASGLMLGFAVQAVNLLLLHGRHRSPRRRDVVVHVVLPAAVVAAPTALLIGTTRPSLPAPVVAPAACALVVAIGYPLTWWALHPPGAPAPEPEEVGGEEP